MHNVRTVLRAVARLVVVSYAPTKFVEQVGSKRVAVRKIRALIFALIGDASGPQREQVSAVVNQDLDHLVVIAAEAGVAPTLALTRVANEVLAGYDPVRGLDPASFSTLLKLEADGSLSATQAKAVLAEVLDRGGDPVEIAQLKGFEAMSEDSLATIVTAAIDANPEEWASYVAGNDKLAGFFVGQVMTTTSQQANGGAVMAELRRRRSGA